MRRIDANELNQLMERDESAVVLDVLPESSFEKQHIPGARNVPLKDVPEEDFVKRVEQVAGSRDNAVVVYCADTECPLSEKAAKTLEDKGFSDVLDFEGGLDEWKKSGNELVSETGATR